MPEKESHGRRQIAKTIIYEHIPRVRAQFDEALGQEIRAICDVFDAAMATVKHVDQTLPRLPESEKFQVGHSLGACQKALNDILGSLEDLRSGRLDHAQAILRMVDEGFATAVLVAHNTKVCQSYSSDRYSVNDSVQQLRSRHKALGIPKGLADEFEKVYKVRHKTAHPSFASIALSFDFDEKQLTIGGAFIKANLPIYRAHLHNLVISAKNIMNFLDARLLRPASESAS